MPRPDTLPANVTWIINTASNMEAVDDASCDLVFSGQNLEHLWADEVSGFLVEAARVTKNGGHLVVDSPNRDVTRLLNWSHPEHTIELTVPEIRQLLQSAGFDVTKEVGLWLCRDPKTGRILPFDPNTPEHDWSQVERLVAAPAHPEHSFLWWLEGRRNDDAPDKPAIDALLSDIYSHAWPERTQRVIVPVNWKVESRADGDWIIVPRDEGGVVFFGPYMPLRAGQYIITFDIMPEAGSHGTIGFCDVCHGPDGTALQRQEITADTRIITFVVDVASLLFGGQFRCFSTVGGFAIRRGAALSSILA
jgi:SAM-dependent methyltransferase